MDLSRADSARTGVDDLAETLRRLGQEHVLAHLARLAEAPRTRLSDQLLGIDWALFERLRDELMRSEPVAGLPLEGLEPASYVPWPADANAMRRRARARRRGEALLREGKVAAFLVAGGQGTRLGFDGPKGCFPIGPVSDATLFQWHFHKVLATRRRAGARLPLLVMTSPANHDATLRHLEERGWYGLPPEDVWVFRQGMLPAVDPEGRLLLAAEDSLALSPDGHGGALAALRREGILDRLERLGIEDLFYFQVDNPLVAVLDPVFLGLHRAARSEASSKVVLKRDAEEKVGVFGRSGDVTGVVEYSDLPRELMEARDEEGRLRFRAGNVAIHVFSVSFLRRLTQADAGLPYHRAFKKVAHVDGKGRRVVPDEPNAYKFETFVFDAIPRARRALVVETLRHEEFSPVKNADGVDSPRSARRDLSARFRSWFEAAGWTVPDGDEATLEISPLFALDVDEFCRRFRQRRLPEGGIGLSAAPRGGRKGD